MKFLISLACLICYSCCIADEEFAFKYKSTPAQYGIYGGELGEIAKPTSKDAKVSFFVTGPAAREMFNAMPPDMDVPCSADKDFRYRARDNHKLVCTKDKDGYACHFGFDLKSGKSIGGSTC